MMKKSKCDNNFVTGIDDDCFARENIESCSSLLDKYNFLSEFSPRSAIDCKLVQNYIHNIIYQNVFKEKFHNSAKHQYFPIYELFVYTREHFSPPPLPGCEVWQIVGFSDAAVSLVVILSISTLLISSSDSVSISSSVSA